MMTQDEWTTAIESYEDTAAKDVPNPQEFHISAGAEKILFEWREDGLLHFLLLTSVEAHHVARLLKQAGLRLDRRTDQS